MSVPVILWIAWVLIGIIGMAYVSVLIDRYVLVAWDEIILRHLICLTLGPLYPLFWYGIYIQTKESPLAFVLLTERKLNVEPRPKSFWNKNV